MPILRKHYSEHFTQMPNCILQDSTLSHAALGVLTRILSYPDNWEIHKKSFYSHKYGRDKITQIFRELQEAGFLTIKYLRKNGKFIDRIWVASNYPQANSTYELKTRSKVNEQKPKKPNNNSDLNLTTENPSLGHLRTENQATVFQSLGEAVFSPQTRVNTNFSPNDWKSAPNNNINNNNIYTKDDLGVFFDFDNDGEEEKFFEKPLDPKNKELLKIGAGIILSKFNKLSKNLYNPNQQNLAPIISRLKEGNTVRECIQIILRKHKEWKNKDLIKFLTPTTIFKNNFDEYLAELRGAERALLTKQKQLEQNNEKN